MSPLTVLAAIGIVVFVIGQQVVGSSVSGKRLVVLPVDTPPARTWPPVPPRSF